MGNKQTKSISGKDSRLFDINARGEDIYPQALKEKKSELRAELFRHAGLCFRDEKEYIDAARSFSLAGDAFSEIEDCQLEASEAYQSALLSWAVVGTDRLKEFETCIEHALELCSGSQYPKLEKSCRTAIAQGVCIILNNIETLPQLQRFLRYELLFKYVSGDLFDNSFRTILVKMRTLKLSDMYIWARVCKAGMQYYQEQFVLDDSFNEIISTLASGALLSAYLARLQPEDEKISPPRSQRSSIASKKHCAMNSPQTQSRKPSVVSTSVTNNNNNNSSITNNIDSNNNNKQQQQQQQQQQPQQQQQQHDSKESDIDDKDNQNESNFSPTVILSPTTKITSPKTKMTSPANYEHSHTQNSKTHPYHLPNRVNFTLWFKQFGNITCWTKIMRQAVWNITSAADCGDIDAIMENFRYLTVTLRKDLFQLLPHLSEVYQERFEVYIAKAFILKGEWCEEEHQLDEDGKEIPVHQENDPVDDADLDFLK